MKKTLTIALAFVLVLALGIGGTLAWLSYKTDTIVNTFTLGDLSANIYETDKVSGAKITGTNIFGTVSPGDTLHKDPTIEIDNDGWVFIGVDNPNGNMITFTTKPDWALVGTYTVGETTYDVYGYGAKATKDDSYTLFDEVKISNNAVNGTNKTVLKDITVIGFAVQYEAGGTAQLAWDATFKIA